MFMSHTVQANGKLFQFTSTTASATMRLVLPGPVKKASSASMAFHLYAPYAIAGSNTGPANRVTRLREPADDAMAIMAPYPDQIWLLLAGRLAW